MKIHGTNQKLDKKCVRIVIVVIICQMLVLMYMIQKWNIKQLLMHKYYAMSANEVHSFLRILTDTNDTDLPVQRNIQPNLDYRNKSNGTKDVPVRITKYVSAYNADDIKTWNETEDPPKKVATILRWRWKEYHGELMKKRIAMRPAVFKNLKCPVSNCQIISGRNGLNETDLIWFDMDHLRRMNDMPHFRKKDQKWLYFTKEPPTHSAPKVKMNSRFNVTMTYRLDSDIVDKYGGFAKLEKKLNVTHPGLIPIKSILWLVSDCHAPSNRHVYAKELRKHIPIEIYGSCGISMHSRNCTAKAHSSDCTYSLKNEFRYCLAFENSLCTDYVTEKFFGTMVTNTVPIALGKADYAALSPKKSFLDVKDFKSPKHLADFIYNLDKDKEEYLSYFKWKEEYKPERHSTGNAKIACEMCRLAHQTTHKVYKDMVHWWGGAHCVSLDIWMGGKVSTDS